MPFTLDIDLIENDEVKITENTNGELEVEHTPTGNTLVIDEGGSVSNFGADDPLPFEDSNGDTIVWTLTEDASTGGFELRTDGTPQASFGTSGSLSLNGELTENASL